MRKTTFILVTIVCLVYFMACKPAEKKSPSNSLDEIATAYVKLGLDIGRYDPDFVDAYYGPDSLKPQTPQAATSPAKAFLIKADSLIEQLQQLKKDALNDTLVTRVHWLTDQLVAYKRRVKIYSGERADFDLESKELFGVVAPHYDETYFKNIVASLDTVLPGKAAIAERFQQLASHFIIPKDKLDTVFKTALAVSRQRTLANYRLPETEKFSLEYVTGKPWSGYNWYQGNYESRIQLNTDIDIYIERAIDVASHESYPGHHVYNMLLEENLYRGRGWKEISLYPLFSPQSLIAEGSANYGIEVAFPGDDKIEFAKNVLLPLAGLDTTGISLYFKVLDMRSKLGFVKNEVARGLINKTMTEETALEWLMQYGLTNKEVAGKSISFIKKYGSYVINYNYGQQLVKNYIEAREGEHKTAAKRWEVFGDLLRNEVPVSSLSGVK